MSVPFGVPITPDQTQSGLQRACTEQPEELLSRSHCTAASLTVRQWPRGSPRSATRALLPDNEKTTTTAGGRKGGKRVWLERKAKAPLLPPFPNYSQLSTLAHSLAACLSARRVRPSRGRSSPRPSVSRSVQTDALRETESIGRRTRAAFPSGERAGGRRLRQRGGGGRGRARPTETALRARSVSRKRAAPARSFAEEPN